MLESIVSIFRIYIIMSDAGSVNQSSKIKNKMKITKIKNKKQFVSIDLMFLFFSWENFIEKNFHQLFFETKNYF